MSELAFSPHQSLFHHATAKVNGIRLHYVTAGKGEPLLLLHGYLGTWYTWRKVIPFLANDFRVIAPDLRGFGDSDKPISDCDARMLCEDLRCLVHELGVSNVRIAAHDIGAPPALLWAALFPDEVRELAYLDYPLLTTEAMASIYRFSPETMNLGMLWWGTPALAPDLPEILLRGNEREFLWWFYRHHAAHPEAVDDAIPEYLRTYSGDASIRASLGPLRAIFHSIKQTEEATEKKMQTPIMALGGDRSLGDHVQRMLTRVAVNVTGGVIADCGHFIPEEQPELLVGRLRSFFVTDGNL